MASNMNTQYCEKQIKCEGCKFKNYSCMEDYGYKEFTNYSCRYGITIRLVRHDELDKDNAPNWCPLKKNNDENMSDYERNYNKWAFIGPLTPWDEIKVGKRYHIAPHLNCPRMDIKIEEVTNYNIRYREIVNGKECNTYTVYPSSLKWKFFVESKMK